MQQASSANKLPGEGRRSFRANVRGLPYHSPATQPCNLDPCNPRAQSGLGLQPVVERLIVACFAKDGVHLLAVFLLSAFSRSILSPLSVPDCPLCTTHILSLAAPLMFGEASLQPQALHIEHSASSPANGNCRPSEDTLVNRRRSSDNTLFERSTMPQACNTTTPQEDVARKRSFGIGGAGNIRSSDLWNPVSDITDVAYYRLRRANPG